MRTTIAALCVLGLLAGCERKSDRTAGAELDRAGADTMASTAAAGDTAAALRWGPAPPGLPTGGRMAVVDGDPSKPGSFTVRLEAPKGYEVKPHHHPTTERVQLISGAFMLGHGKNWDDAKLDPLAVGSEVNMAARQPHYVRATEQSIVEIRSEGPFEIVYESPADDPRKKPVP